MYIHIHTHICNIYIYIYVYIYIYNIYKISLSNQRLPPVNAAPQNASLIKNITII